MQFSVNQSVFKRIAELSVNDNISNPILRISVDGGGCNGLMYKYEFCKQVLPDDFIIERDNIKIAIDSISQPFLEGCEVNFVEELGGSFFEIKNPNALANCGCGNSFSI